MELDKDILCDIKSIIYIINECILDINWVE